MPIALLPSFSFHIHDDKGHKIDDPQKVNFPELMQKAGA